MPMYEYQCAKCRKTFEVLQKFSDPPVKKHEGCGGKVARLVSAPAFQFKGSGWYVTDYAKAGAKTDASEAKAAETKATEAKTGDTKPSESKTEGSSAAASDNKSDKKKKTAAKKD